MAKGAIAKQEVTKKIAEIFGSDYIGEYDKKLYVFANENGEKVQIAISLTCPKNPVAATGFIPNDDGGINFEEAAAKGAMPTSFQKAEITPEEQDNIAELMARLGL